MRRGRAALLLTGGVAAAWAAWCAWNVVQAHNEIQAGRELVRQVQTAGASGLLDGEGRAQLQEAIAHFEAADGRLGHSALAPFRLAPVGGRQLRSAEAMTGTVSHALNAAERALVQLDGAIDDATEHADQRAGALQRISEIAGELGTELHDLDLGPQKGLIGRLATARAELSGDLDDLRGTAQRTERIAGALAGVLRGPGRWLLLAANNAQMQNGSGMFLTWAVLEVSNGSISLVDIRPAVELVPAHPVPLDPDQAARWPWMDPNVDVRHLGTSARFDATAATAAALFEAAGYGPVDGVLSVDPIALRAVLRLTGPVDVDGTVVSADTVVPLLLHDQYQSLVDGAIDDANAARRDQLSTVAASTLSALGTLDRIDVAGLKDLAATARARHLMAWSPDTATQVGFEAAGISGALAPDGVLLSLVNRGGNKLDWFVDLDATLTVAPDSAGDVVSVTARFTNEVVPEGEPRYVAGPFPGLDLNAGDYLGVVTLTVPGEAQALMAVGTAPLVAGPDGDQRVVGVPLSIAAGSTAEVSFNLRLPPGQHHVEVASSARARPTAWTAGDQTWDDVDSRRLYWSAAAA